MKEREGDERGTELERTDDADPRSGWRLHVVQHMLAGLETLTRAGQRHQMEKIVGLLEEIVLHDTPGVGAQNRAALLANAFAHLRRELQAVVPNARAFCHLAKSVAELAARVA